MLFNAEFGCIIADAKNDKVSIQNGDIVLANQKDTHGDPEEQILKQICATTLSVSKVFGLKQHLQTKTGDQKFSVLKGFTCPHKVFMVLHRNLTIRPAIYNTYASWNSRGASVVQQLRPLYNH